MKYSKITCRIETDNRKKVEELVSRGLFKNMSEFYRLAINRLLREIAEYEKARKNEKRKALQRPDLKIEENMKDIAKFVDDLF
jgi:Arc/MetJ-type ribon-helix-helix transcriptional regulator